MSLSAQAWQGTGVPNPSDAIWPYNLSVGRTVYDLCGPTYCLPNSLWSNHQRIHQYSQNVSDTQGGITLNIDKDFADGPVAIYTSGRTPPSVTTNVATSVTANAATLNASVNPNGLATTAYFQWGTSTAYGNTTPSQSLGSGTSATALSANLSGLAAATTYYYRVVATNSAGTVYGSAVSFTTTSAGCVEIEPNDSSTQANPLSLNVSCTGKISSSTDVDWWSVYATSGTTLSYSLTVPSGVDYDMELYGPTSTSQVFLKGSYNGSGVAESITGRPRPPVISPCGFTGTAALTRPPVRIR